jgi:hypothetical protein
MTSVEDRRRELIAARLAAGHYGYLERPAEVNRVLLDFLAT